jgi:hypothetical protein
MYRQRPIVNEQYEERSGHLRTGLGCARADDDNTGGNQYANA